MGQQDLLPASCCQGQTHLLMAKHKQTDSGFFSTYRLNSVLPMAPQPQHSLDNRFFNRENHCFTAQCRTKRIKSIQWSGRSLCSLPRLVNLWSKCDNKLKECSNIVKLKKLFKTKQQKYKQEVNN